MTNEADGAIREAVIAGRVTKVPKEKDKKNSLDDLVRLMDQENLYEIDISEGDSRIKLSRHESVSAPVISVRSSGAPQKKKTEKKAEEPAVSGTPIKSPLAGVFYRSPSPQAAPFVKEGDVVSPDKTVCIVEAMKVLNQINAGVSGRVIKVCVENGKPIQSGQTLFLVEAQS